VIIAESGSDGMRDVFEEIFALESPGPVDPTVAARRHMRALKRRFYDEVTVREDPAGFAVALDGRPITTPARRALAAPCWPLGEAIAAEWRAQTQFIDPAAMPMTRLANTLIDGVSAAQDEIAGDIVKYLGCDLVCYRAATPERLVARQSLHWDPILAWAKAALGRSSRPRRASHTSASPTRQSPAPPLRSRAIRGGSAPCTR